MKKILAFLILLIALGSQSVFAQPGQSNAELANQYFSTGDYDKAVVFFEKFYDQDPFTAYSGYSKCLIALKDYEKAEKLIRKHQKKFPQDPSIRIDLGLLYDVQGKNNDAKKVYEEAINNLKPDINQVNLLGNAFTKNQMFDFAVATYLEGRKLL
ncbi:MAG: tetratricopeptide repeat protein, partial [Bacteroidia bacterium]|nr:tetratricopeptide repeat protein [Bacteroidia bacterium]MBP7244378.1 tetratricopeptide repeat protein [Bacteroidia bacterium]